MIEIDQSVKIEQLSRNTVIALSNDIEFAVSIPSKVKRKLQTEFRRKGKPKLFRLRTFVAGVVLLIYHAKFRHVPSVVIDREYAGQEQNIQSMFVEMWQRHYGQAPSVSIKEIGKRSKAHDVAYFTMSGKRKVDRVLTYSEMRRLVFGK